MSAKRFTEKRPCYDIDSKNDFALIINNQRFARMDERRGSDTDLKMLEDAMRQFGYEVVSKTDLEAEEISKEAEKISRRINANENSSSFVCVILTYGDKGKIYGSDSECINLKKVTDAFKANKCRSLSGKPKLFFIEACGVRRDHDDDGYDYLNDSEFRCSLDPVEPHFLIAISLAPEKASFKGMEDGTWVISALTEIFTSHCHLQDVCSMLLNVNKNASSAHAKKGFKQSCQLVFTTTKIVKFRSTRTMNQSAIDTVTERQNDEAQPYYDDWCYNMEKQYNVAVIINLERFQKKNGEGFLDREGSDGDAKKLRQLWEKFGFVIKVPPTVDLTSHTILEFLKEVAKEINEKKDSSCFVCCIMTHGSMGKIFGSDNIPLDIYSIIDLFKVSNCKALAGRPKIFFIQACRGHPELEEEGIKEGLDAITLATNENSEIVKEVNPHETDFLIGYSTLPGNTSHRDTKHGTFYINALVEIFQKYHQGEDLLSMMTRVNKKLVENELYRQCPAPVITLTRKVYFSSTA